MNPLKLSIALIALIQSADAAVVQPHPAQACMAPTFQEQVREAQNWRQSDDRGAPAQTSKNTHCGAFAGDRS